MKHNMNMLQSFDNDLPFQNLQRRLMIVQWILEHLIKRQILKRSTRSYLAQETRLTQATLFVPLVT